MTDTKPSIHDLPDQALLAVFIACEQVIRQEKVEGIEDESPTEQLRIAGEIRGLMDWAEQVLTSGQAQWAAREQARQEKARQEAARKAIRRQHPAQEPIKIRQEAKWQELPANLPEPGQAVFLACRDRPAAQQAHFFVDHFELDSGGAIIPLHDHSIYAWQPRVVVQFPLPPHTKGEDV